MQDFYSEFCAEDDWAEKRRKALRARAGRRVAHKALPSIKIVWNFGAYIQGYTPNVWHVWLFASLGAPPVWVLESSWRGRCYQGTWGWMKVHKLMFTDIFRLIVLFGLEVMATHPIWPRLKIRTTQTSSCSSLRALAHNFQAMPRWRTLFFVVSTTTYMVLNWKIPNWIDSLVFQEALTWASFHLGLNPHLRSQSLHTVPVSDLYLTTWKSDNDNALSQN